MRYLFFLIVIIFLSSCKTVHKLESTEHPDFDALLIRMGQMPLDFEDVKLKTKIQKEL